MNIFRSYYPIARDISQATTLAASDAIGSIIVLKRIGAGWQTGAMMTYGVVENLGDSDFTFAAAESSDNAVADAYAATNIYVTAGSSLGSVASATVPARGKLEFILVYNSAFKTESYVSFTAVKTGTATGLYAPFGMLGLAYSENPTAGYLETRNDRGV